MIPVKAPRRIESGHHERSLCVRIEPFALHRRIREIKSESDGQADHEDNDWRQFAGNHDGDQGDGECAVDPSAQGDGRGDAGRLFLLGVAFQFSRRSSRLPRTKP